MEVLGVLSGIGHLPVEVARSAKSLGYEVIAVGVVPDIDPELATSVSPPVKLLINPSQVYCASLF